MLFRVSGSLAVGIRVVFESRPRLIGNEIFGNGRGGVSVSHLGDPHLSGNTIRDHAGEDGTGVLVGGLAHGRATVLPDNVFLRNEGGDVVREPAPEPPGEEDEDDEEEA